MALDEAALEARRAYQREWRRKNKDKVKAQNERYWQRKARQKAVQGDSDGRIAADSGEGGQQ